MYWLVVCMWALALVEWSNCDQTACCFSNTLTANAKFAGSLTMNVRRRKLETYTASGTTSTAVNFTSHSIRSSIDIHATLPGGQVVDMTARVGIDGTKNIGYASYNAHGMMRNRSTGELEPLTKRKCLMAELSGMENFDQFKCPAQMALRFESVHEGILELKPIDTIPIPHTLQLLFNQQTCFPQTVNFDIKIPGRGPNTLEAAATFSLNGTSSEDISHDEMDAPDWVLSDCDQTQPIKISTPNELMRSASMIFMLLG